MGALAETLKILTIDSIINGSAYYNSDENDAEGNPKSNPLVATHTSDGKKIKVTDTVTTNGNYAQKLLINRTLPIITMTIDPQITNGIAAGRETPHARQMPISKVIIKDAAHSSAHVL